MSALEQLELSDRVFSGTVVSVEEIESSAGTIHRAFIRTREIWKGDDEGRVAVDTMPRGSCNFTLSAGANYLIYADATEEEGIYSTHECQRTRLRANADEDLVKLGEPQLIVSREEGSWAAMKSRFGASDL
jgi:hypothetical protein